MHSTYFEFPTIQSILAAPNAVKLNTLQAMKFLGGGIYSIHAVCGFLNNGVKSVNYGYTKCEAKWEP
jgi:hypothetical protein